MCAEIPDNQDPRRIHVKKEPGHVFLILSKTDTVSGSKPVYRVFGFYPRRPASSILFKNVNCLILDNGDREYNAFLHKELTAGEFSRILDAAIVFSRRKYNLNKYNCYDYALDVFNSLPGIEKLPVTHVKFPFILGHGSSPCGLYLDLRKLKENCSAWVPNIEFGIFQSP